MGIGDWGLATGDWRLGSRKVKSYIPNHQSLIPNPYMTLSRHATLTPIPNPQSPILNPQSKKYYLDRFHIVTDLKIEACSSQSIDEGDN